MLCSFNVMVDMLRAAIKLIYSDVFGAKRKGIWRLRGLEKGDKYVTAQMPLGFLMIER